MTTRPSADLRSRVIERAAGQCEYCLVHQSFAAAGHQVDHIIAEKHGGRTISENLALSCALCNRRKGSDISSVDPESGEVVPLFHPREQNCFDHFRLQDSRIIGLTPAGRATVELLQLNVYERLLERAELIRAGRYPPSGS